MSLYRFGANLRPLGKIVAAMVVSVVLMGLWGCGGSNGASEFNNVALLRVASGILPNGKVGDSYSATIGATGGAEAGYTWSLVSGDLPSGLTLGSIGTPNTTIFGTPSVSGSFALTIRVQDARGETATATFLLTVTPATLSITTANPLPDANVDRAYSVNVTATLGTGAGYMWNIQPGGQLPTGLFIAPTGTPSTTISGIPTDTGTLPATFTFTVRVIDSGGFSATKQFQLHVNGPLLILTDSVLVDGCVGNTYAYAQQPAPPAPPVVSGPLISATGGSGAPYVWSTTPSIPIPGLTINPAGLSGTGDTVFVGSPTLDGTFNFTITVSDNVGNQTTKNFTVTIHPFIALTPGTVADGTVGEIYEPSPGVFAVQFNATGGPPLSSFVFSIPGAGVPGMSISLAGAFAGTPTTASTYIFNVEAATGAPPTLFKGTVQVTMVVVDQLHITTLELPTMNEGTFVIHQIAAAGGVPGYYQWQVVANPSGNPGGLPPGLNMLATGYPFTTMSGTPGTRGNYEFTIEVADSAGRTAIMTYFVLVDYAAGIIETRLDRYGDGRSAAGSFSNHYLNGAGLWSPSGVCADAAGNIFIADTANHLIRRVDAATGVITTIGGTGIGSSSGSDGTSALLATIYAPWGIAVLRDVTHPHYPSVYFSEFRGHRIRRIDLASGNIFAVAGTTSGQYNGDGTPATNWTLHYPRGLSIDNAGNIYVADTWNHRIRKITHSSGLSYSMTTVVGTKTTFTYPVGSQDGQAVPAGSVGVLNYPSGVAISPNGVTLLIADSGNSLIRRVPDVNLPDGTRLIERVVGTPATGSGTAGYSPGHEGVASNTATVHTPRDVVIEPDGSGGIAAYYIADAGNMRIRKVTGPGGSAGPINTICGSGSAGLGGDGSPIVLPPTANPTTIGTVSGMTYFKKDAPTNAVLIFAQSSQQNSVTDINSPFYYATFPHHAVRKIDLVTNMIDRVAGWGRGRVFYPYTNHTALTNNSSSLDGGAAGLQTNTSLGINNTHRFDGAQVNILGNRLQMKITRDEKGYLYVADMGNHRVLRYDPATDVLVCIAGNGTPGAPSSYPANPAPSIGIGFGTLNFPTDVAINPQASEFNPDGSAKAIYIADFGGRSVRRVTLGPGSQMFQLAGLGTNNPGDGGPAAEAEIGHPTSLTFDIYNRLYVATYGSLPFLATGPHHNRIRVIDIASSTIGTFMNTDGRVYNQGDNGPASGAQAWLIWGMGTDAANLYFADPFIHRVRRIGLSTGTIEHFAGNIGTVTGGSAGFSGDGQLGGAFNCLLSSPMDVTVSASGVVFIADYSNNRIRKVDSAGTITTIAGTGGTGYNPAHDGGPAVSATLWGPTGVYITPDGSSLWVMDTLNGRLRRVVRP